MKKLKYFIISLMMIVVCMIPVVVYAAGESNPGGGTPTDVDGKVPSGGGGSQILREYGYIVSLQSVGKSVSQADAAAMKGNNLTSCTLSVGKELMYKFPVSLTNTSTAGSSRALLQHPMSGISPALGEGTQSVYYTAGNHSSGVRMNATVYPYGTSYTENKWDYTQGPLYKIWKSVQGKNDDTSKAIRDSIKFGTGDLKDVGISIPGSYPLSSAYVQSVMYLFADYSNAVPYINEVLAGFDNNNNSGIASIEKVVVYFDICAAINTMCNYKFKADLLNLYQNKNSDAATVVVKLFCNTCG